MAIPNFQTLCERVKANRLAESEAAATLAEKLDTDEFFVVGAPGTSAAAQSDALFDHLTK